MMAFRRWVRGEEQIHDPLAATSNSGQPPRSDPHNLDGHRRSRLRFPLPHSHMAAINKPNGPPHNRNPDFEESRRRNGSESRRSREEQIWKILNLILVCCLLVFVFVLQVIVKVIAGERRKRRG